MFRSRFAISFVRQPHREVVDFGSETTLHEAEIRLDTAAHWTDAAAMTLAPVGGALGLPADEKVITFSGSFGGVTGRPRKPR